MKVVLVLSWDAFLFLENAVGREALCPRPHSFQSGLVSQEHFAAGLSPGTDRIVCRVPGSLPCPQTSPCSGVGKPRSPASLLPVQVLLGSLKPRVLPDQGGDDQQLKSNKSSLTHWAETHMHNTQGGSRGIQSQTGAACYTWGNAGRSRGGEQGSNMIPETSLTFHSPWQRKGSAALLSPCPTSAWLPR